MTANQIYRGYDIEATPDGFTWVDEQGGKHTHTTDEQAMDAIDAHRRRKAAADASPAA